jgi:uncharacterized SAM-binding protein YcdF (DUF218 family)
MSSAAQRQPLAVRALRLCVFLFLLGCLGFLAFLPFAGRFLDHQDPLAKADLIYVLAGARVERVLEGIDLYKEGWAPRLVMSPGIIEYAEIELRKRGVTYPRDGDLARDTALAMGVPADVVSVISEPVDNTAQEAAALQRMAGGPLRRIIVVTSPYHTRRTGFAFRRQFDQSGVEVLIRGSRYTATDPPRWWRRRAEVRFVMTELPKLIAYLAGLGE